MDLHREVLAPAERASDPGEVDPHLLRLEPEAGRDLVAVDVNPLRRHVDVHAALAVGHGQARLGPEEGLVLLAELVDAADRDVALGLRVAVRDHDRPEDVRPRVVAEPVARGRALGMQRLLLGRALGVDDELERLVLDPDALRRAPRLLRVLGGDQRDRLAEVADAVDREHRLVGELEPVGLGPGDVVVREHRVHARHRERLGDVELDDPRVRMRAAQRVAPEHPLGMEVARIGELARDLRDGVDPPDALPDPPQLECRTRAL